VATPSAAAICLLDDDLAVLKGIGRLLRSAGWPVERFSDPNDFLAYAETHQTPVAIIDVWMPRMNGLEVQSRLQQISPSTRVIVFSGIDDAVIRENALKAGASAFFIKPFDDEEFLGAIETASAAAA
jgi:FixJ family two-component response regulator